MNGSSRLPSRKPSGAMRPPARPPTRLQPPHSSPAPPRSRASTASPSRRKKADTPDENVSDSSVNVVVRCRGRSERERAENSPVVVSNPGTTEVGLALGPLAAAENKLYTFDRTFGPEADQQRIYDNVVAPLLNEVLCGYNCTIFAYGQTGTGKTYTMTGDMSDNFGSYADFAGIIPRVLYRLFEKLGRDGDQPVKCSFIELYNEELRDLLSYDESQKVKIFDAANGKGGVVVQGMEETFISTAAQGVKLLQEGSHKRQVAATKCNDLSSRSHTVFTITVGNKDIGVDGEVRIRTGKLNLVDLAGSENIGRSGAENKRAREAGIINQSLLTLGRVINALVDKSPHIPYRESKLTRLLQDSLGGRTKTTIIATISPAKINLEETMSTLDYASRAKNIKNKPQVNQMLNKKTVIAEFVSDIERLKSALHASRLKNGIYFSEDEFNSWNEKLEVAKNEVEEAKRDEEILQSQIVRLREQFEGTMRQLLDTRSTVEEQKKHVEDMREILKTAEQSLSQTTVRLEEETILRKAHQKTEAELGNIGNQLISTARSASSDIEGLRAKIGRMANSEVENHSTWMKNTAQVSQVTEDLETAVESFVEEQEIISGGISERIQSFVDFEATKLKEAYDYIEERIQQLETTKLGGYRASDTSKDEMITVLGEIKQVREDIKKRVGESLMGMNTAAESMSKNVIADLGKFGIELQRSYSNINQNLTKLVGEAQDHVIKQRSEIKKLRKELADATAAASSTAAKAQSNIQTILGEERQKAKAERQNLISQISNLINTKGEEQDSRMAKRVEAVQAEIGTTRSKLEEANAAHEAGMDSWSAREGEFYSRLCDAKETVRCVLAQDWKNVQKHNNAIQETTKSIHAQTVKLVEEQTESVGVQLWELEEFVNRARAQNQRIHTDSKESITRLFDGGCESIEQFASLIKGFHDEVGSFEEVVTMATIGLEKFDEFGTNTRQRLSQLRTKVESEPLKECLPTGQTPRKRKFTFPATLPSTGAADDVVARARGTFYSKRPALGEKEVNSPKKLTPNATTLVADDVAKSGGAGIGATFYPTVSGKKKVLREALGTENDGGVKAGEADGNVFLSGDGTANRRQSLRKRKVGEAGEGTEELASISTTRRRLR